VQLNLFNNLEGTTEKQAKLIQKGKQLFAEIEG
jgi:hypothetical protein